MDKNEVSILLEILDLEYLKPILIDRFRTIRELTSVNLREIGIENQDDLHKLQYVLEEFEHNNNLVEQYNPILSMNDSYHMVARIENETNLISSSLNLLFDSSYMNLPKDDATSDIEYVLYNSKIDQIQNDIERLQNNTEELIEDIEKQFPQLVDKHNNQFIKGSLVILTLSICCIGLIFFIKRN